MIKNKLSGFWGKYGFYIVLGMCVATVGLTAYFTKAPQDSAPQETASPSPVLTGRPAATPARQDTQAQSYEYGQLPASQEAASAATEKFECVPPVEGTTEQGYSAQTPVYNRTLGLYRVHQGLDIAAPAGSVVRACADGEVAAIYQDDMLGCVIEIDHGLYTALYASLEDAPFVSAGDPVTKGQGIACVGICRAEAHIGEHLHFELYKNGEAVDPAAVLE